MGLEEGQVLCATHGDLEAVALIMDKMNKSLPVQRKHVLAILGILFVWSVCLIGVTRLWLPPLIELCCELWTGRCFAISTQLLFQIRDNRWWVFPCAIALTAYIVARTRVNNATVRILTALTIMLMMLTCVVLTYAVVAGIPAALAGIIGGLNSGSPSP